MGTGDPTISTGGGASAGDIQTGRDFVGRDQTNINIEVINWPKLSTKFIADLKNTIQDEKNKQEDLEKEQKNGSALDKKIQIKIDRLIQLITKSADFDWSHAERVYLNKLIKLYDRVRILGNSVDVPLGNVFTQVYILDELTARQRYDIEELLKHSKTRPDFQHQLGQRIHGMELVKTNQNLFILGKPGAGKTTFLKYITIQAARKQLPRIPIFVSLNLWADSKWGKGANAELLPFIVEQFAICGFPDAQLFIDYLLKDGRALVLFDGLDEVKQEKNQRRRLIHLLQDFAHKYDQSQCLITCRIAASDYAFAGFADVEVADFTPDQVDEYARNWFGASKKKFEAFATELAKPENRGLAELCNTPLLLALLCLTFDNTMRFPPSRAELYENALETLLSKWDGNREIQRDVIYRALSHKRKLQLLMSIAVPTFEKGDLFFRQRNLEQWIVDYLAKLPNAPPADMLDGTAILKAIEAQHSILVERAQGIYSFSHLTFQEYLTARYLAENHGRMVTSKLMSNHLTDQRWREVFLLTASLLDDADDFMAIMRITTDSLLVDTLSIRHLLAWSYDRTPNQYLSVERRAAVQLAYIFLARALGLSRALAISLVPALEIARNLASALNPDPKLASALGLGIDLTPESTLVFTPERSRVLTLGIASLRESASERSRVLTIEHERALDIALELKLVVKRVRELAQVTTAHVGFDYGIYYAWTYATVFASEKLDRVDKTWQANMQQYSHLVEVVAVLANEAGLTKLSNQLVAQHCPLPNANWRDWQQYALALFIILRDKRDLVRKWNFSDKEIDKLGNYFYANELLVQCLKIAVVSDRQAMLERMLVPPHVGEE